jgi:hypothetical protein
VKDLQPGDLLIANTKQYAQKIWPYSCYVVENYGNGYIKVECINEFYVLREEECELVRRKEIK